MVHRHDYSEIHTRLHRAISKIDRTRREVGRTNIPPTGAPQDIIARIDDLDALLQEVSEEFAAARLACSKAGRRGLHVVQSD